MGFWKKIFGINNSSTQSCVMNEAIDNKLMPKELVQADKASNKMNGHWVKMALANMYWAVNNKIRSDIEKNDRTFTWERHVEIGFLPFRKGIRKSSPSRTNEIEQVFISMEDMPYSDRLQIAFSNAFILARAGLPEMKNLADSDPDAHRGKLAKLAFSHSLAETSLALLIVHSVVYPLDNNRITIPSYAIEEYYAQDSLLKDYIKKMDSY